MSYPVGALRATPSAARQSRPTRTLLNVAVVLGSLVLAALLAGHALIPDVAGVGLLIDSALPWFGLGIPVLFVASLFATKGKPWVATLVPALVWAVMFVPMITPLSWGAPASAGADASLTVGSQNVEANSGTAAESAATLAATGAQVLAFQEMDEQSRSDISTELADSYPYSYAIGTVGVWSVYPVENAQAWDLGLGWQRALAADIVTPQGPVSIYVIHAASARPGDHADRDTMLANLADVLPNDENDRVILVGDFNTATTDRHFGAITAQLSEPNQSAGMFGFTWPANFPVTRLDHVMQRGMTVTANTTLSAGDSDHLAILTSMNLD